MESLVKAASDFLAAVLSAIGFVGRPRRRAAIRQDLELLRELEKSPEDFGRGTWPHTVMTAHVALEVAKYSGVELPHRRRPWSSIVLALLLGAPLGYLAYKLNQDGFDWYSLFPGVISGLLAVSILGMLFSPEEQSPSQAEGQPGDPTRGE